MSFLLKLFVRIRKSLKLQQWRESVKQREKLGRELSELVIQASLVSCTYISIYSIQKLLEEYYLTNSRNSITENESCTEKYLHSTQKYLMLNLIENRGSQARAQ